MYALMITIHVFVALISSSNVIDHKLNWHDPAFVCNNKVLEAMPSVTVTLFIIAFLKSKLL